MWEKFYHQTQKIGEFWMLAVKFFHVWGFALSSFTRWVIWEQIKMCHLCKLHIHTRLVTIKTKNLDYFLGKMLNKISLLKTQSSGSQIFRMLSYSKIIEDIPKRLFARLYLSIFIALEITAVNIKNIDFTNSFK